MLNRFHHVGIDDHYVYPDDHVIFDNDERTYYDVDHHLDDAEFDSPSRNLEHVGTYNLCSDHDWAVFESVVKRLGPHNVLANAVYTGIVVLHRRTDR